MFPKSALKAVGLASVLVVAGTGAAAAAGVIPTPVKVISTISSSVKGEDTVPVITSTVVGPSTTVVDDNSSPTTIGVSTPAPGAPLTSPPTTCVVEPGDDSCSHRSREGSEHANDDHDKKTVPSVPHKDNSGKGSNSKGHGSDDAAKVVTSTTVDDHSDDADDDSGHGGDDGDHHGSSDDD